jgi:hypothetical protein
MIMAARAIDLKQHRRLLARIMARRPACRAPPPAPVAAELAMVATPRARAADVDVMPTATARVSAINPDYPVFGTPTTVTVRNNFAAAKNEIEELQDAKLDGSGGVMRDEGMMRGRIVFVDGQVFDGGVF